MVHWTYEARCTLRPGIVRRADRPQSDPRARAVGKRLGWEIVGRYIDEGISGTKGRDQRPALTRIPQMDRVDRPERPGNAGETADSSFHPSRPPGFGHLVQRK